MYREIAYHNMNQLKQVSHLVVLKIIIFYNSIN